MSKVFKLNSAFQPSGDQPEAIRRLKEGLEDGLAHQTLLGVTGSGKTFTVANVIADLNRPAMVLAPNKTLAAQLYGEMKEFFPDNAVEFFVSYYDYYQPEAYVPSSDTFIEKDASVNEHIEQMRLSATKALLERRDVIVVASVSAIYGLGDPDLYLKMMLHLTRGMIIDQRSILRRLAELQYARNDQAFQRGTFRVRGERARRSDRYLPGGVGRYRAARRAVRRRGRAAVAVRSAYRPDPLYRAALYHLSQNALRDAARTYRAGDGRYQSRAGGSSPGAAGEQ